jgi:hypothetical protein
LEVIAGQVYGPELFIYVDCPEPAAKLGTLLEYLCLQKENPERKEKRNRAVVRYSKYCTVLYRYIIQAPTILTIPIRKRKIYVVISESFQSLYNFPTKRLAEN